MNSKTKTKTANAKPAAEERIGSIKAAIWQNETDNGTRYNVTFSRLYTVTEGDKKAWKSSESFGRDDLLAVAKVANLAHTRILELQSEA